jgi:hypothetical protein
VIGTVAIFILGTFVVGVFGSLVRERVWTARRRDGFVSGVSHNGVEIVFVFVGDRIYININLSSSSRNGFMTVGGGVGTCRRDRRAAHHGGSP